MKWYSFEFETENNLERPDFWNLFIDSFYRVHEFDNDIKNCEAVGEQKIGEGACRRIYFKGKQREERLANVVTKKSFSIIIEKDKSNISRGTQLDVELFDTGSKRTLIRGKGKIAMIKMNLLTPMVKPSFIGLYTKMFESILPQGEVSA